MTDYTATTVLIAAMADVGFPQGRGRRLAAMAGASAAGAIGNAMYNEGWRRLGMAGRHVRGALGRRAQRFLRWGTEEEERRGRKRPRLNNQMFGRYRRPRGSGNLYHMKHCVEYKTYGKPQTYTTVPNTGLIESVLGGAATSGIGIKEGTGYNERIGRKIFISRINIQGKIYASTDAAAARCQQLRVMIVIDKQSNGTAPAVDDLLDTATAPADVYSFRNLENTGRFHFLSDRHYTLAKSDAGEKHCINFNFTKRFPKGLQVTYDQIDGSGTPTFDGEIDEIKTNNVWVVAVSEAAVLVQNPTIVWASRVRYTD